MERLILLELCPALVLFVDVKHPKENSHTNETKNGRRDIETDGEIYREHDEARECKSPFLPPKQGKRTDHIDYRDSDENREPQFGMVGSLCLIGSAPKR